MNRAITFLLCLIMSAWMGSVVMCTASTPDMLIERGNSLIHTGQYDAAVELFSQAEGLVQPGDTAWAEIRLGLAKIHYRKGEEEPALAEVNLVLEQDPSDGKAKAWSLMLRGMAATREANIIDSLRLLTDAIKVPHDDIDLRAECFMNRGHAYLNAHRASEAISDLNKALELDPDLSQARRLKKQALLLKKEVDQAYKAGMDAFNVGSNRDSGKTRKTESHTAAASPKPATPTPVGRNVQELINNGGQFLSQENYAQAIDNYTAALNLLNPSDRNVPVVRIARAYAYAGKGDLQHAWDDATFVTQSGHGDYRSIVPAFHLRGMIAARKGQFEEAVEEYTQAVRAPHQDKKLRSKSFMERARMFMGFGEHEKAISDLDNAITWDPGSGMAYLNRCKAYMALGELNRARPDCQSAVQKGLPGHWAQSAKDLLNELSAGSTGPKTVRIPLDQRGHMHVQIKFSENGRSHRFMLDTGASGCLITRAMLESIRKEAKVTEIGRGQVSIADGSRHPCTYYRVGEAFLYDLPLGATEVIVYDREIGRIGNLFGTAAMKNLSIQIDNIKREAEITLLK